MCVCADLLCSDRRAAATRPDRIGHVTRRIGPRAVLRAVRSVAENGGAGAVSLCRPDKMCVVSVCGLVGSEFSSDLGREVEAQNGEPDSARIHTCTHTHSLESLANLSGDGGFDVDIDNHH